MDIEGEKEDEQIELDYLDCRFNDEDVREILGYRKPPTSTGRNHPNSAEPAGCEAIGHPRLEHLQLRYNDRRDRAPAKALRTTGRPTSCDRESFGSHHPFRSTRRGPSAAGAGNRPDENTPQKHPTSA